MQFSLCIFADLPEHRLRVVPPGSGGDSAAGCLSVYPCGLQPGQQILSGAHSIAGTGTHVIFLFRG